MIKHTLLFVLAIALIPAGLFAVDGVVLINQSTVAAAGGFPYIISQPGSYKLSGNLTMITTQTGNYQGGDIAIAIAQNNVSLDLNGFTIYVVNNINGVAHPYRAIAELGTFTGTSIKNGHITLTGTGSVANNSIGFAGIDLRNSTFNFIEDVSVFTGGPAVTGELSVGLAAGKDSVVRKFITDDGSGFPTCPSVVVESIGLVPGAGCQTALNIANP